VPGLAAQLAVGGGLEPDLALHPDDLRDGGVLDLRELLGRDQALRELLAGLEHRLGTQQAADVVGAEGRTDVLCHAASSFKMGPRCPCGRAWCFARYPPIVDNCGVTWVTSPWI